MWITSVHLFWVLYQQFKKILMLLRLHHINNCVYLYWKQHHFVWLTDRCCCTCLWLVMTCRIPLTNPLWSLGMSPMNILFLDEYSSISTRTSHGALWGKCTQPAYTHTHIYRYTYTSNYVPIHTSRQHAQLEWLESCLSQHDYIWRQD